MLLTWQTVTCRQTMLHALCSLHPPIITYHLSLCVSSSASSLYSPPLLSYFLPSPLFTCPPFEIPLPISYFFSTCSLSSVTIAFCLFVAISYFYPRSTHPPSTPHPPRHCSFILFYFFLYLLLLPILRLSCCYPSSLASFHQPSSFFAISFLSCSFSSLSYSFYKSSFRTSSPFYPFSFFYCFYSSASSSFYSFFYPSSRCCSPPRPPPLSTQCRINPWQDPEA